MNRKMRGFVICMGLVLTMSVAVQAMEHPRPGEVEELIATSQYGDRVEFANQIGNHRIGSYLLQKLKKGGHMLGGPGVIAPPPAGQGMPSSGVVRTFMLLIEFQDYPHAVDTATVDDMLYGAGNPANYPKESLASYYDRSSYGLLDLSEGATLGWYQTAYDRSAVTEDDAGREALIKEAMEHFDAEGHDFSQYDNDGNGVVDYFMVMWTGPDTGWGTFWWGYQTGWTDAAYMLDGVGFGKYSWQWEADQPTVVIHETGHGLGLPDYYDYDVDVGPDGGVGGFDIMDGVWDHNCFSKWMLGWLTPTVVDGSRQDLTLNHTSEYPEAVLIWPGVGTGDMFSEYYMVQNRQDVGNDDDGWFNVDGLAIWHIDATLNPDGTWFAYDNSFTDHKLLRLMEADGMEHIETATCDGLVCSNNPAWSCEEDENCKFSDADDAYSEGVVLSNLTFPSSAAYDGSDSCVTVCDIVENGTDLAISAAFTTECSQQPVCEAGGPYLVECNGTATTLTLDGTGSSDPDSDDTLTYFWETDCPGGIFDDPTSATPVLMLDSSPGCLVVCNVSLTVTDCAGNTDGCSTTLTVTDVTVPFVQLPPDITIECDESTGPENTGTATGMDECDPAPMVSYVDKIVEGSCPQERVILRTWIATDECGNSGADTQRIDVVDTTAPVVDCPADVEVTCGDSTDPDATGMATAVDNCDPDPVISYEDVETLPDCLASPVMYYITRTWTAVDACGNAESCEQVITVLKVVHYLDIKPGSCPNSFNRRSNGVLPVSLVGTADFDVSTVNIASLRISRVDCVGGSAAPNEGPKGPHTVTEDVATPFEGEPCDCHEEEGDGWLDLSMKFNSPEVTEALQLAEFEHKDTVEVAVTGTMADGCEFIAYDCLRIVGNGNPGGGD